MGYWACPRTRPNKMHILLWRAFICLPRFAALRLVCFWYAELILIWGADRDACGVIAEHMNLHPKTRRPDHVQLRAPMDRRLRGTPHASVDTTELVVSTRSGCPHEFTRPANQSNAIRSSGG